MKFPWSLLFSSLYNPDSLIRLVKLESKKKMHRKWKQRQVPWEECRNAADLCRDGVRKAKAQLQLNLARSGKKRKKAFYRYLN